MSSTTHRDSVTEDLLERIRNLKELLRKEEACGVGVLSQSSSLRESKSGVSSPPTPASELHRPGRLSPPTRDSPPQPEGSTASRDLIAETWHLLSQVTYVRIAIDRLTWEDAPKFLLEELSRPRNPRQKSLIVLEYWLPMVSDDDGSMSSRDVGKKVRVPAKDVLSRVVHFNHRRVMLVRITQPLLHLWAQASFTIKIFSGRKLSTPLAKCSIPLCKLLVLPFSLHADVPLESAGDHVKYIGKLKICIQLGSRFQSFCERVEPMRNPTTTVSDFAFIDPMKLVTHVPSPAVRSVPVVTDAPIPIARSSADDLQSSTRRAANVEKTFLPIRNYQPSAIPSEPSSHSSPLRTQRSRIGKTGVERRMNETFCEESETTRDSPGRREYDPKIGRLDIYETGESETAWLRYLASRREPGGRAVRPNVWEPYVSNISVYGNRPLPVVSQASNFGFSNCQRVAAAAQTEPEYVQAVGRQLDAGAQTSFILEHTAATSGDQVREPKSTGNGRRRRTVAEKILMNRSSNSLEEIRDSLPPASEQHLGFWLQLTIHRARRLALVKENQSGHNLIKPCCFWTYCSDTNTNYSPVATDSCEPVWEWSHKLFVPPHRKTLVLKLWHRSKEGRDRVLGFVAILFPIVKPFERVCYDIIDLTRSTTGQVEVSFAYASDGNVEESLPTSPVVPAANLQDEDLGVKAQSEERANKGGAPAPSANPLEHELTERGVNTTLPSYSDGMIEREQVRTSCSSPFIALTSRSYLSQKLRTNLEELSTLTAQLKRNYSTVTPAPSRSESTRILESETAPVAAVTDNKSESVGMAEWQEEGGSSAGVHLE